jgi:uncharacterized protein YheU (UPF0270 family)
VNDYDDLPLHLIAGAEVAAPVAIPHTELSADALEGVIKSFVLREGTDYGEREFSLEQKIAHVRAQLERGDARILFDPNSASVDIVRDPSSSR